MYLKSICLILDLIKLDLKMVRGMDRCFFFLKNNIFFWIKLFFLVYGIICRIVYGGRI